MTAFSIPRPSPTRTRPARIGVVSFINTLPLIDGLDQLADIELRHSVPSLLIDQLVNSEVDLALCSSIDYQRSAVPLQIVPVGVLGCHGPTLTVRLYSTQPIETLTEIYCDTDSHTSVALLRIILGETLNLTPRLIDYDAREHVADNHPVDWPPAMLLIGDKVVTDSPPAVRYPHQLDLGEAWHQLTGLPFVFATWMARADADPDVIAFAAAILDRQRRHNLERIDRMIHHRAVARGWPADLARDYLTRRLVFEATPERIGAMETFFTKAAKHQLIASERAIQLFSR